MAQISSIAVPAAQVTWHYSSFWRRMFALFIDGIILGIPALFVRIVLPGEVVWDLVFALIGVVYYIYLNGRGATLGKKAMGIHIVDGQGNPPGTKKGAIRYIIPGLVAVGVPIVFIGSWTDELVFGAAIFAIFATFLWLYDVLQVIWHPYKQALHDVIARTYVIYD